MPDKTEDDKNKRLIKKSLMSDFNGFKDLNLTKMGIEEVLSQLLPILRKTGLSEVTIAEATEMISFQIQQSDAQFAYAMLTLCKRIIKNAQEFHTESFMYTLDLEQRISKLEELNRIIPLENKKALSPSPPSAPK